MSFVEHDNRSRALGLAGAMVANVAFVAALLTLGGHVPVRPAHDAIEAIVTTLPPEPPPPPPPPPPPDDAKAGAAAPPSRGATKAPSPPPIPRPLPTLTPAQIAVDPGPGEASGMGTAPGSGGGTGGQGSGSGSGAGGNGRGSGRVSPPIHISGELTNADYRRAGAPRGAAGTVVVSFRVRSDGAADQCAVLGSSGFAGFDESTCRLIEQRFRFRPALDESGRPVDWTVRTDYTWAPR